MFGDFFAASYFAETYFPHGVVVAPIVTERWQPFEPRSRPRTFQPASRARTFQASARPRTFTPGQTPQSH